MGILDSKKRVVDIAITPLGRAALAQGGLNVAYASFTDGQAYYDASSITGSYDTATDRIYLECPSSLPQDTLALVTDDSGDLIPSFAFGSPEAEGVAASSGVTIGPDGTIYSAYSGNRPVYGTDANADFSTAVTDVVSMFQRSFEKNMIVGTRDPIDESTRFIINPNEGTFQAPPNLEDFPVASINRADSVFFDKRFSNLPQFKFLPPVVGSEKAGSKPLAAFKNIKKYNSYTYEDIKTEVIGTDKSPVKQRLDIKIEDTSPENDLVLQLYEVNTKGVVKLDAVDYGNIVDSTDVARPLKRIIFFGKVFLDDTETVTFINLFTMVID